MIGIGQVISHYKILKKLGQGGMGVVYMAEDLNLKRTVAMKFLISQSHLDGEDQLRFTQEAQAAARLDHPNICTVYEIGESSGQAYIVMAHIEGKTLKDHIRYGEIGLGEAVDIAIQIAKGLREAHDSGIVHRDVKSANIMLTPKGSVKVMDFGIAKVQDGPQITKVGSTIGTLTYMAPEQVRGKAIDHRTDIWSMGVVFYEMLTGSYPFQGSEFEVIKAITSKPPQSIKNRRAGIPREIEQIINRCLEKDPDKRYQTLSDMIHDLYRVWKSLEPDSSEMTRSISESWRLESPQPSNSAESETRLEAPEKERRKNKLVFPLLIIFILTIAGIGYFVWNGSQGVNGNGNDSTFVENDASALDNQAALDARSTMISAEQQAIEKNASVHAADLFSTANQFKELAEEEFARGNFDRAKSLYDTANDQYSKSITAAAIKSPGKKDNPEPTQDPNREQRRLALQSQAKMQQAKTDAIRNNAAQNSVFLNAQKLEEDASNRLRQNDYAGARSFYDQAAVVYASANSAQVQILQSQANLNLKQMETVKADADKVNAVSLASDKYSIAKTEETKGRNFYAGGQYLDADAAFQKAREYYQAATDAANSQPSAEIKTDGGQDLEEARQEVAQVKNQTDNTFTFIGEYRQAERMESRADTQSKNGESIAADTYQQAAELYRSALSVRQSQVEDITSLINNYEAALEDRSIPTLQALYIPTMRDNAKNWEIVFKRAKNLEVDINTKQILFTELDRATVYFDIRLIFTGASGSGNWNSWEMKVQESSGQWLISEINQSQ